MTACRSPWNVCSDATRSGLLPSASSLSAVRASTAATFTLSSRYALEVSTPYFESMNPKKESTEVGEVNASQSSSPLFTAIIIWSTGLPIPAGTAL